VTSITRGSITGLTQSVASVNSLNRSLAGVVQQVFLLHNEAAGAGLTGGSAMSTTENLRKDDVIEVRKLHLADGGLSNDELATVTGGETTRIVCADHKVIVARPK